MMWIKAQQSAEGTKWYRFEELIKPSQAFGEKGLALKLLEEQTGSQVPLVS